MNRLPHHQGHKGHTTNAATLSTIEPVVTVVLASLILGETITPLRILGGMMILLAVIFLARGELPAQDSASPT
jgi:drug/metabolite transporter (DMT)-like permease